MWQLIPPIDAARGDWFEVNSSCPLWLHLSEEPFLSGGNRLG